ncbi:MAG: hypothetical protein ACREBD_35480 [Blastocatellia bacterium]
MSYSVSGETSAATIAKGYGQRFSKADDVQEGRLEGYGLTYGKSGVLDPPRYTVRRQTQHTAPSKFNPARRDTVRRGLALAERLALEMESCAQVGDLMELSNVGFALAAALGELWELRDEREDDWGDLLNLLQGALAKEEFEEFSVQQCAAIRMIVADHLNSGYVDIDDIERSLRLLRTADFDPWKGISGTVTNE